MQFRVSPNITRSIYLPSKGALVSTLWLPYESMQVNDPKSRYYLTCKDSQRLTFEQTPSQTMTTSASTTNPPSEDVEVSATDCISRLIHPLTTNTQQVRREDQERINEFGRNANHLQELNGDRAEISKQLVGALRKNNIQYKIYRIYTC